MSNPTPKKKIEPAAEPAVEPVANPPLFDTEALRIAVEPETKPIVDPNPFAAEALRVTPDFEAVAVKPLIVNMPVRRPKPQEFHRTHPNHTLEAAVIHLDEEGETYVVTRDMVGVLADELKFVRLHLTIARGGALFFWPVPLPGANGRRNSWHETAHEAARQAVSKWLRVRANRSSGAYDVEEAAAEIPEPTWPDKSMDELLALAFKDRLIASIDHPVVRRLKGQA
jgi:hypothetical protein